MSQNVTGVMPAGRGHAGALGGALLGFVLGTVPATLFAFRTERLNPWFVDDPLSYTLITMLPLALLCAAVGLWLGRRTDRAGQHPRRAWALKTGVPLAILQGYLVLSIYSAPTPAKVDARLVVVGIDGASWELLDRPGWMPTVQALKQDGAHGVLRSREPMFSPLLWTTMATGMTPEVHGIHGFRVRADQAQAARWWEVAHDQGLRVGMYKWLVTWPPADLSQDRAAAEPIALDRTDGQFYLDALDKGRAGFTVPAWLAPSPETWPDDLSFVKELELSRRLKRKRYEGARPSWQLALAGIDHGFRWTTLLSAVEWTLRERFTKPRPEERAWRLQLLRAWMDRDVFIWSLHFHRPDVASFTTYATDALGHTHWGFMEEGGGGELADALPAAYRQADVILAEVLRSVEEETIVVVVSDHGFRSMSEDDAGRYFAPKTERLKARLTEAVGRVDVSRGGHKITVALLEDDVDAQKASLETFLADLTQASTGQPFYRWEPVPDAPRAVGLTLADERVDEARLSTDTVGGEPLSDYAKLTEEYSGEHDEKGILLVRGPGIEPGRTLDPVPLLDLTPTLLALADLPAAIDMPGHPVFGETLPRVATWEGLAPGEAATGDADVNTEALKALGYIED